MDSDKRIYSFEEALRKTAYTQFEYIEFQDDEEEDSLMDTSRPGGEEEEQPNLQDTDYHQRQKLSFIEKLLIKWTSGTPFQMLGLITLMVSLVSHLPIVTGLAFLEKEPPEFECLEGGIWISCLKSDICDKGMPDDQYRPVDEDSEYIYNWVEKFDMLCESRNRVGLLGSCYFMGTFSTILLLPVLADIYGRQVIYNIVMIMTVILQLTLMLTYSIDFAYYQMVLMGMTFAGKNIVGMTYYLEFMGQEKQQSTVLVYMYAEPALTMYLAFHYQFIDRTWFSVQLIFFLLQIGATVFTMLYVPESPKYLFSIGEYEKSRDALRTVAVFNGVGVDLEKGFKYESFQFIQEELENVTQQSLSQQSPLRSPREMLMSQGNPLRSPRGMSQGIQSPRMDYNSPFQDVDQEIDRMNMMMASEEQMLLGRSKSIDVGTILKRVDGKSIPKNRSLSELRNPLATIPDEDETQNLMEKGSLAKSDDDPVIAGHVITESMFKRNVVVMTILWSVGIFDSYLMLMLNKYLEGSIYTNFYLEGLAGVVGSFFAELTLNILKLRNGTVVGTIITIIGGLLVWAFEGGAFSPNFVHRWGFSPKAPFPEGSEDQREYYLAVIMPYIGFFTKIGINIIVQNAYQGSFSNDTVFPVAKRATAIGICNFFARGFTIFAPIVAELEKPIPSINLVGYTFLAFFSTFFIPSFEKESEIQTNYDSQPEEQKKEIATIQSELSRESPQNISGKDFKYFSVDKSPQNSKGKVMSPLYRSMS